MALAFCYAFGLLTSAMPRSGGDYTLVSRHDPSCDRARGLVLHGAGAGARHRADRRPAVRLARRVVEPGDAGARERQRDAARVERDRGDQQGLAVRDRRRGDAARRRARGARLARDEAADVRPARLQPLRAARLRGRRAVHVAHGVRVRVRRVRRAADRRRRRLRRDDRDGDRGRHRSLAGLLVLELAAAVAIFSSFGIYAYITSYVGGELRDGSSIKTAHRMAAAALLGIGVDGALHRHLLQFLGQRLHHRGIRRRAPGRARDHADLLRAHVDPARQHGVRGLPVPRVPGLPAGARRLPAGDDLADHVRLVVRRPVARAGRDGVAPQRAGRGDRDRHGDRAAVLRLGGVRRRQHRPGHGHHDDDAADPDGAGRAGRRSSSRACGRSSTAPPRRRGRSRACRCWRSPAWRR